MISWTFRQKCCPRSSPTFMSSSLTNHVLPSYPVQKIFLSVISIASRARFLIILIVVPMLVVFRTSGDTRCTPTQTRRGEVPSRERIRLHLQKPGPSFTAKEKRWRWYKNPGVCGTKREDRTSKYTQQKGTALKLKTYYVKCVS